MSQTQQGLAKSGVANARMLLQLLFIGYFLLFVFTNQSAFFTLSLLVIMTFIATWIALNVTPKKCEFVPQSIVRFAPRWTLCAYFDYSMGIGSITLV